MSSHSTNTVQQHGSVQPAGSLPMSSEPGTWQQGSEPHPALYCCFPRLVCRPHVGLQHWQWHIQRCEATELPRLWVVPVLVSAAPGYPPASQQGGVKAAQSRLLIPAHGVALPPSTCCAQTSQVNTVAALQHLRMQERDKHVVDAALEQSGFASACQTEQSNVLCRPETPQTPGKGCHSMQLYVRQVCSCVLLSMLRPCTFCATQNAQACCAVTLFTQAQLLALQLCIPTS